MAAALAETDDVAAILQRALTTPEIVAVSKALDYASAAIRKRARQTLSLVTDDEALLYGNWTPTLTLPERPVVDVTGIEINGRTLVADVDYVWRGKHEILAGPPDTHVRQPRDWGGPHAVIAVTYSHGYAEIPADLVGVCVGMVQRYATAQATNPEGIAGESLSIWSVTYRDTTASMYHLTDEDREIVDTYQVSIAALLNQAATVTNRTPGTEDELGNAPTVDDEPYETVGYFEQTTATEVLVDRETYLTDWLIVLPAGTPINGGARVDGVGRHFEIVGEPAERWNPRLQVVGQIEMRAREVPAP